MGPNSPKNGQIFAKFAPEVVLKERNTVLKFLLKIPIFIETARYQSLNLFTTSMKEAEIEKKYLSNEK